MAQINKPNEYFNPVTYTGNGTTQSITGVNFQPDFVWVKSRNFAEDHQLTDSVRGATKVLQSNLTDAESTMTGGLTSFDTDGFSVGNQSDFNYNNDALMSWNWKAGGTAVSNTDGTITSSVSANTTSGFSIVSWTGTGATATVGHGLGTTPKLFIVKERSEARNWPIVTTAIDGSWDGGLYLNLTDVSGNSPQSANSSVFNFTSSNEFNASGQTYIAYAFAEVKGFSKFGKYDGNAGVGAFVNNFQYLGFKPALVLIKSYNAVESWNIFDNKRNGYNYQNNYLVPNTADAETSASNTSIDLLSNGFNPYYGTGTINRSGKSYIYMAFAEQPLVGTNGIPATAR
jgi:hypothetical protein